MFVGLAFALICGVFCYTYLKITIDDLALGSHTIVEARFLVPFIYTFVIIASGFVVLLFLLGRALSHRTAGPLYAFERFLEDVLNGKDRSFKLREGDDFTHLVELAERVRTRVQDQNFSRARVD
jgi:signal peptidase II